ncbi:MAG: glycosyltransferase family 4 protein [Anaeromyxobacteraceae bacterium]
MKVLVVADAVGGVFTWAMELARALRARGVEVVLATEGARLAPDQRLQVLAVEGLAHEEGYFRLEWMPDPWAHVAAAGRWLLDLERRHRPDVVHLSSYAHGALPFRARKVLTAHSCVPSWLEAVRGEAPGPEWDRYRREARAGLLSVHAIAAPTRAMAQALQRHHGPIPEPVIVPNGRTARRFLPGTKQPLIAAAGRVWDEAKNVALLVRLAPRLAWPVAVAGEQVAPGAPPPPLRPNGPGARLLGRLREPELAAWLGRSSIFVHPARYEPFGLAVLEAALAGNALVLGDIPSLREVWGDAAVYVTPDDEAGLASALGALITEPRRRAALALRARTRALSYDPGRMLEGTLALYRRAVTSRPAVREEARP